MGTHLVHILTIIGKASVEAEIICDDLLGRRVSRSSGSYGTDDWSDEDHGKLATFCEFLISKAEKLPVLYYAKYLDPWSSCAEAMSINQPDGKRRVIFGKDYDMAFYPYCFRHNLMDHIKTRSTDDAIRTQPERRWYLNHLNEATETALWLDAPFLVVTVSQVLGPSRHDEEIEESLELPLGFIASWGISNLGEIAK